MGGRARQWQMAVHALCVLSLVVLGLAHRPLAAASADMPLFMDLCLGNHAAASGSTVGVKDRASSDSGVEQAAALAVTAAPPGADPNGKHTDDHHQPGSGCEACRIGAAMGLPIPPAAAGLAARRLGARLQMPPAIPVRQAVLRDGHGPRGPPRLLL